MGAALKNILCVDDDPDILEIAKYAFLDLGDLNVETCCNGKDALERAPEMRPDIILLDVLMPDMDGMDVYRELRMQPNMADVPVVFMTARVQPSDVLRYLEMGIEGIIPKPFDPVTLPDEVKALWASFREKSRNSSQ